MRSGKIFPVPDGEGHTKLWSAHVSHERSTQFSTATEAAWRVVRQKRHAANTRYLRTKLTGGLAGP